MATSSTAAEAPSGSAPLHSDHIICSSDPAEASHTVTQPASKDQIASQEGTQTKRRSSRRHVGNSNVAQPAVAAAAVAAGEQQHSTDQTPQASSKPFDAQGEPPLDKDTAAEVTRASAGRSSFRDSARKEAVRLQAQSEVHGEQTGREQGVAPPAAAAAAAGGSSAARWTRAGSVGRTDVKESSEKPSGSQEKQTDVEQGAAGEPFGSERDRRILARRQHAAAKSKSSKPGRGRSCA